MRSVSILERPTYEIGSAADVLRISRYQLRAWLDGYERGGKQHPPVIRPESTGDDIVTWGEFVELGYLREYRKEGVPLQRLRPVISRLREELQTPYPLATAKPYVDGSRELVLELQDEHDLPDSMFMVIRSGQMLLLAEEADRYYKKVVFEPPHDGDAYRIHPAGPDNPIVVDPLVRFGRPNVDGVEVERLWELRDAGESVEEIADSYDMRRDWVNAAIKFQEEQRRERVAA